MAWEHKWQMDSINLCWGKNQCWGSLFSTALVCLKATYLCMTCVNLKIFFQILKYISSWWLAVSPFLRLQGTEFLLHKLQDHPKPPLPTASASPGSALLCLPRPSQRPGPRRPLSKIPYSCWQRLDICSPRASCRAILQLQQSFLFYFSNQEKGWTCNVNIQPGVKTFQP